MNRQLAKLLSLLESEDRELRWAAARVLGGLEAQEPDPWLYALHHCTTAANIYSPVRWVDITGRHQQG